MKQPTAIVRTRHSIMSVAAFLTGCHSSAATAPVPSEFSRLPFAAAASAPFDSAEVDGIYLAVLDFYRPVSGQVRRIEDQLLPVVAGDFARPLDPALATRLVQRLGPTRYCFHGTVPSCLGKIGGGLRLSSVDRLNQDQARLVVHFEGGINSYAPKTAFSGTEVFLVRRDGARWRIQAHAPAQPQQWP